MAIAQMDKVMIVTHRSEAEALLDALQQEGIMQVLNAERAMVSKEWPELHVEMERPLDIEEMVERLDKAIEFLKGYAEKGQTSIFSPRAVIDKSKYSDVVRGREALEVLDKTEEVIAEIDKFKSRYESASETLVKLAPWKNLKTNVEEARELKSTTCIMGLLGEQHFDETVEKLKEVEAAIEVVGESNNIRACVVVCMNEVFGDVQKILRSADFDVVSFEGLEGSIAELIEKHETELGEIETDLSEAEIKAGVYGRSILDLQILFDHYENLLSRENARRASPATEYVVLLEGWAKKQDYKKLEKIVESFEASTVRQIVPGEGEEIPVEIDNNKAIRPFEVITRLYGMPLHFEVDPTIFLAPFFALFFGICLSDGGYGLLMIALAVYYLKKSQGDKKFGQMFLICSVSTVICGALTGSWFGDAIPLLNIPWLNSFRNFFLRFGFDPSADPMIFFAVSLIIGYIQLMFGITVALLAKLLRKDILGAIFDHLTWLVMLNSLVVYGFSRSGRFLTPEQGEIFLTVAAIPAGMIFLFSHREGSIVARLGMGFYNLASTMFYIGDTLSYVRLMALGMVTAGFASAINQMAIMSSGINKFAGPIIAVIVLVGLHSFNLGISVLGSFVHSLRLQYVEFFPKFFVGGGKLFEPLSRRFKYIYVNDKTRK